jgi:TATA-box binding protein (TBP) (component of TFIID and TFIIIB)
MHPLLQEVVDGYEGDEFEPPSGDLHVTQHNLVLVINYGKIGPLLSRFCQHNVECRRSMETFPCLMKRFRYPAITMMAFEGGMTVFVGGYNFPSTLFVALVQRIELEEFRARLCPEIPRESLIFGSPHKANLVFTVEIPGGPFNLAEVFARVPGVKYTPGKFPGANMVLLGDNGYPLATVVFFEGGLANLMGCKSLEDAQQGVAILYEIISEFKCAPRQQREEIVKQRERERDEACARVHNELRNETENAIMPTVEFMQLFVDGEEETDQFAKALFNDEGEFDIIID